MKNAEEEEEEEQAGNEWANTVQKSSQARIKPPPP